MRQLCVSQRIDYKTANKLVSEIIQFGEWKPTPYVTPELLKKSGPLYALIVAHAQDILKPVPNFENLCGPTWMALPGESWRVRRTETRPARRYLGVDKRSDDPDGGVITKRVYHAKFRAACELLISAARSSDVFEVLLSAISKGLPSIDSFIVELATAWNFGHPQHAPFDIQEHTLNAADRIDRWVPTITGKRFDKSTRNWRDYKMLIAVRNDFDQHPKYPGMTKSLRDLAALATSSPPA